MKYDIFMATSVNNQFALQVAFRLCQAGMTVYSYASSRHKVDWSKLMVEYGPCQEWGSGLYAELLWHQEEVEYSCLENLNQMRDCKVVLLVHPCGRSAHMEAGIGVGLDKPLVVYIPILDVPDTAHWHAEAVCDEMGELIAELQAIIDRVTDDEGKEEEHGRDSLDRG